MNDLVYEMAQFLDNLVCDIQIQLTGLIGHRNP